MLESKAMSSGMRVKLYSSNPAVMYYFIRYCDIGTRHYFRGPLNVSAYTFDGSTRAFSSVRLSVNSVRPLVNLDEEGKVIGTTAPRIDTHLFERNHRFLKLKYIVYKYGWEHIHDEDVVMNRGLNVEAFALQLSDMYEYLVTRSIIISNFNPVVMEETISRPATNPTTIRPVPRVMRVVYSYNEAVQRLDD
ncbi:hypothetical protein BD770DRAFT_355443 [Pilaira anomala]|nr:hypothetical protein BD770DRAFT_355443 [Pilaira anomala]